MSLTASNELFNCKIKASDGDIGAIHDVLFDDFTWIVRYAVVDTGNWLPGRRVLISPVAIHKVEAGESVAEVNLSKEQVKGSPSINAHKPVSRQQETELSRYYGWPAHWSAETQSITPGGVGMLETTMPRTVAPPASEGEDAGGDKRQSDPRLRSVREVRGYHIQAQDGEIGHVDDFIIETDTWWVQSLIVNTRNWLPGKKVGVSPSHIEKVRWTERMVYVKMIRDEIMASPELDEVLLKEGLVHD